MTKRILLVDDEPQNLDILRIFLNSLKYELFEVNCGMDALQAIKQKGAFDLILLDVMMPDISGLEVCTKLKKAGSDIPIIFLSAKAQKEDVLLGLQAGAVDYLTKPFDLDLLEKKISIVLQNKKKHSELQRKNARLVQIAYKDGLTNLYNRTYLNRVKTKMQKGLLQYDSILLIDIDNFKEINDQYGHLWGDKALCRLSEIINLNINSKDDIAFRYGGDEFLVLLQHSSREHSEKIADAIHNNITSNSFVLDESTSFSMTVCIGIAQRMTNEMFENQFNRADRALFDAKERGRNMIQMAEGI